MAQAHKTGAVVVARQGKTYPSLLAWIEEIEEVDLPLLLPAVAFAELDAQKRAGSTPSNILVDNRAARERDIVSATKRVQLFFLDVELLARAVELAHAELERLYRRKTGESARTIQIWGRTYSGGFRHERLAGIGSVRDYLSKNRRAQTFIRLLGPDVPFRRQLYYSPRGARSSFRSVSRVSARRLKELEHSGAKARTVSDKRYTRSGKPRTLIQVETSSNVNELVVRKVKAQFGRTIFVSGRWIQVPVPSWRTATKRRQGVPAIALGWRLKGSV